MKIYADNGTYLGKVECENTYYIFKPRGNMTKYMLEQTLKRIRKIGELNGDKKIWNLFRMWKDL